MTLNRSSSKQKSFSTEDTEYCVTMKIVINVQQVNVKHQNVQERIPVFSD